MDTYASGSPEGRIHFRDVKPSEAPKSLDEPGGTAMAYQAGPT